MTERVWISGKFPTANDYINACRRNVHAGGLVGVMLMAIVAAGKDDE